MLFLSFDNRGHGVGGPSDDSDDYTDYQPAPQPQQPTTQPTTPPAAKPPAPVKQPSISGTIVAGGPLTAAEVTTIDLAGPTVPAKWRRYIAYSDVIKVGGALTWRANNPGNLRTASTKIATVPGAVGTFAVFATIEDGRAAQRALYVNTYGAMTVRAAIKKLTPDIENDTEKYLRDLAAQGVDLDKDVKSQIDLLMAAVAKNEGKDAGIEVVRTP